MGGAERMSSFSVNSLDVKVLFLSSAVNVFRFYIFYLWLAFFYAFSSGSSHWLL